MRGVLSAAAGLVIMTAAMEIPKRQSEMFKKYGRRDDDRYLTAAAVERLKRELRDLEEQQRPQTVEDLTRAREMGDLSENAAYHDAKARLGRIDGRIFSLKERIKNAVVIEPSADGSGRVQIGSTVILNVNGKQRTYQILGSQETNPATGRISHLSPLGAALLGHAAGETVTVRTQDKETPYRIDEVK